MSHESANSVTEKTVWHYSLSRLHLCMQVGIFDADVYGPSLPLMVNPEIPILEMDPETKAIKPTTYEGVSVVSFGFAGQGSAIMRGPMVSGLIQQMLTTTDWGEWMVKPTRK